LVRAVLSLFRASVWSLTFFCSDFSSSSIEAAETLNELLLAGVGFCLRGTGCGEMESMEFDVGIAMLLLIAVDVVEIADCSDKPTSLMSVITVLILGDVSLFRPVGSVLSVLAAVFNKVTQ